MTDSKSPPKFLIWSTMWWGYRYAFTNFGLLWRCAGVPFIVYFALFVAGSFVIIRDIDGPQNSFFNLEIMTSMSGVIGAMMSTYLAVAWHRAILLGETNPGFFRFVGPEIRYGLVAIALVLAPTFIEFLVAVLAVVTGTLGSGNTAYVILIGALTFLVFILSIFVFAILPGIAIGDRKMEVRRTLRCLKGNRWRIFVFVILSACVAVIIYLAGNEFSSFLRSYLWFVHDLLPVYPFTGQEWVIFAVTESFSSLIEVGLLMLATAGFTGGTSISYAGIANIRMLRDSDYQPPEQLMRRMTQLR